MSPKPHQGDPTVTLWSYIARGDGEIKLFELQGEILQENGMRWYEGKE
jgi:hypothetical protein